MDSFRIALTTSQLVRIFSLLEPFGSSSIFHSPSNLTRHRPNPLHLLPEPKILRFVLSLPRPLPSFRSNARCRLPRPRVARKSEVRGSSGSDKILLQDRDPRARRLGDLLYGFVFGLYSPSLSPCSQSTLQEVFKLSTPLASSPLTDPVPTVQLHGRLPRLLVLGGRQPAVLNRQDGQRLDPELELDHVL
jgi:hypothetical protein